DIIERLPPGTGVARRREQQIDKASNRGALVAGLAYSGRFAEARRLGESWLAGFAEAAATPGEFGSLAKGPSGLAVAYAYQGEPVLARQCYAAALPAFQASGHHVSGHAAQREELILVVLPYQGDDLAERERVATEAERAAAWVIERGGHVNPNLPL